MTMNSIESKIQTNTLVTIDPIEDSLTYPLAVSFTKSSSPNYMLAVELAKQATKYAYTNVGKSVLHLAVFSADRLQMSRAMALLDYIKGLKGTRLFAGGKLLHSTYKTEEVANCYLTALACNDWRAHCHRIIRSPFANDSARKEWIKNDLAMPGFTKIGARLTLFEPKVKKFDQFIFPCSYLVRYGEIHFRLDANSEVSVTNQIQAMGVSRDCAWCPNFKPVDFRKI